MGEIAISFRDVYKTYEQTEAVRGIRFDIPQGEFFGFLGPNGAGKTTTINMITGLSTITAGAITVFGHDVVTDYRAARRRIGFAAQELAFDPFFPLHRVLEFQGGYFGLSWDESTKRAAILLQRFGLWEHRAKTPRQISGGMKRRLLIAKALVHDPDILILDEPTAGVDVELRRDLWNFLQELNHEGKTIMLTTHYIEEAESLCNRIGIIHHGQMKTIEDKNVLMEKLAEKRVEILVASLSPALQQQLAALPGVSVEGMSIRFATSDIEQHLAAVMQLLRSHHVRMRDMNVVAFDLEDIFLQLTENP